MKPEMCRFSLAILVLAFSILPACAYSIFKADVVNCRSSPSTSGSVVRTYKAGTDIVINCQTNGQNILGNSVWDKTQHGCYVSDYYVNTMSSNYVAKKCDTSSGGGSDGACKVPNEAGLSLIKEFEGFVARPAPDPIGLPTVGYGHLCKSKGCSEVSYPFPLTRNTADQLLRSDVRSYTSCLANALNSSVRLNQNQWAALTSWVFNNGCYNAKTSSLVKRLNSGQNPNTVAEEELPKWKYAGGRPLPGLIRRRTAEINLFKNPESKLAYPNCQ